MNAASENGPTPVSVVKTSAQQTADRITNDQHEAGLDQIQAMSHAQVLAAIGTDAKKASMVIQARPSDVGELLQLGLATHQATAFVLLAAARYELVRGAVDRQAIVRSILRISGPGCGEIKESVVALLKDRDKPAYQQVLAEMDVSAIGKSERDQGASKLLANYVDRPDDCVRQLVVDSDDPERLTRDITLITTAVENQPQPGQALLDALAKSPDSRRIKVRLELVRSLSRSVSKDISAVKRGEITDDVPYKHAAKVVPVLAEAMLQPEMAKRLMTMQSRGEAGELELRHLLHLCLFRGWDQALRNQVARITARNAATMFENSLDQGDEVDRHGSSVRTAELIAEVAATHHEELNEEFAKSALTLLKDIADFIPEGAGKAVKGLAMVAEPKEAGPLWTRHAIDQIMRRVYENRFPMPADVEQSTATEHYENAYAEWSSVPLATYTSVLNEKNK